MRLPCRETGLQTIWICCLVLCCLVLCVSASKLAAGAPVSLLGDLSEQGEQLDQPSFLRAVTRAVRRGDRATAIKTLQRAIEEQPELGPAEVLLANVYLSNAMPQQGRQLLEEAAVLYPDDPEPHLVFADLAWRERRLSDASVQYRCARELADRYHGPAVRKLKLQVWALAGLGSVAETRNQFDQARELFTELLHLEPKHPQGHYRLGHVLFALGQPEKALDELRAASKFNPSAPQPELTLAGLYQRGGDSEKSEQWLLQAIAQRPEDITPLVSMARFQLEVRNDPAKATEFVLRAEELAPKETEPQLLHGMLVWRQGKPAEAEMIFEKLALRSPNDAAVNSYLAAVLAEQGDPARLRRASELAKLTAAANPHSVEATATLGWVAYQMGEFKQAEQLLRAASQHEPSGRDAKYYLARTLFRRGQVAAAQQLVSEVLEAEGAFIHLDDAELWRQQLDGRVGSD